MDLREIPRYYLPELAWYTRVKAGTLGTWVRGRGSSSPVIRRPVANDPRLSYNNLIEAYVVNVLRTKMRISLDSIRRGVEYVRSEHGIERFLLSDRLRARHGNLLIEALEGELENVGKQGQYEIPEVVTKYLNRIDYEDGLPARLFPVTRTDDPSGPRKIAIYPDVSFGKPVTETNYISTAVIFDRFTAGESVSELADDYDLGADDVEEAIREEGRRSAA